MTEYKDCYALYDNDLLRLGNGLIEKSIAFINSRPVTEHIWNKKSGYKWGSPDSSKPSSFELPFFEFDNCMVSVEAYTDDNMGLSDIHLCVSVVFENEKSCVKWIQKVIPDMPFISSQLYIKADAAKQDDEVSLASTGGVSTGIESQGMIKANVTDAIEAFSLSRRHLKLEAVCFYDVTDQNDELVKKDMGQLYSRYEKTAKGNVFIIDSYLEDEAVMVIKDGMTSNSALNRHQDELIIKAGAYVRLTGSGLDHRSLSNERYIPCYGSTIGIGSTKELKREYKRYYRALSKGCFDKKLFMMSNTWGDRNQDKAVCEDFMLKEIKTAAELGIDIVQIDDGWQLGISGNSAIDKSGIWEGFYNYNNGFWSVNNDKFPNGLENIVTQANKDGIKIGLWFVPDSSDDFNNWQKDAEVLLDFFDKYGIRYFKLDGINIRNKTGEANLIDLMETVLAKSGNAISFNLDITAQVRFGYFYEKHLGTLFVENRYTDWGNYYPHKTLKNIWQLSEYLPVRRFQFELLNNKRNVDKYLNDPLSPFVYSIDYLFAVTMLANPLIWMEMSSLSDDDIQILQKIIKVYKQERGRLYDSEVFPIGDIPDGISHTGFWVIVSEKEGYFLLFRESSCDDEYVYYLKDIADKDLKIDILYTNMAMSDVVIADSVDPAGRLLVKLIKQRSFVFARYSIK